MKVRIKQKQLGTKIEHEHDDITHGDPKLIAKIVDSHLKEDPKYYTKLEKMEGKDALPNQKKRR